MPRKKKEELEAPEFVKSPVNLEEQKLGLRDNIIQQKREEIAIQLTLEQAFGIPEELEELSNQEIRYRAGLNLSHSENKALHVIQTILASTEYSGNLDIETPVSTETKRITGYKGDTTPVIRISPTEFYELYGVPKNNSGAFNSRQKKQAQEALFSLSDNKFLLVRKQGNTTRIGKVALLYIELVYKGLSQEDEDEAIESREYPKKRASSWEIALSPILIEGLFGGRKSRGYTLKRESLYRDIEDALQSRGYKSKPPRAPSLFIDMLTTLDFAETSYKRSTLIERLRLEKLEEKKGKSHTEKLLRLSFEIAQELGFLLSWEILEEGQIAHTYAFVLNPEECSRVKHKRERLAQLNSKV